PFLACWSRMRVWRKRSAKDSQRGTDVYDYTNSSSHEISCENADTGCCVIFSSLLSNLYSSSSNTTTFARLYVLDPKSRNISAEVEERLSSFSNGRFVG